MKSALRIAVFLMIFYTTSCLNLGLFSSDRADQFAEKNNFLKVIHSSEGFNILTLQRILKPEMPIRIYIESDGFAYVNKARPSVDPTPKTSFLFDLIEKDDYPNIVYIARPCQYVDSVQCAERCWAWDRFSKEMILTVSGVVDEFNDNEIEIVGYSGGAVFALQFAQKNIKSIRTIAGNLDLDAFTRIHKISSLNTPKFNYDLLAEIPQIHFVGGEDKIIPPQIFEEYKSKLPKSNCVKMQVVKGTSHNLEWLEKWEELLKEDPSCK